VELHLSEVLMDDGRGRELARELGLRPLGTLRLLELAAGHALIDLHLTLDALEATNYRIHPRLIQRLRQGHRPPRG
jgi:predicted nucleic acid-binding protein